MAESNVDVSDDFVVVADKDSAEKEAIRRLQTLVEMISQALDAVNQSNLLLRDQVHSALCVTLQHTPSDRTIKTDELIKSLDQNVTSTEEVRSKYVRNLCSKLVDASAEISKLQMEIEHLKSSLEQKEKETSKELKALISATQNLQTVTGNLESSSRSDSSAQSSGAEALQDAIAEPVNLRSLCAELVSICDRLTHLSIQSKLGRC
ncbi:hypothetical protein FBUS_11268 [Fasciolopsis buskii]|uniref:Uncharacterized protein n=1 Tax=Fasciolopsis buskii TaxID=27845 RepID=A0A8E0VFU7_9TREM|nr:hypothetical protein FBUS_11268 [Fasciolopsis buski]